MGAKDDWILFLEKNPQFSELAKSSIFISILDLLKQGSLNTDKIHSSFPKVENSDLDLILESLIELNLISRITFGKQVVFALTPTGRKFLNLYHNARESFKV